MRKHLWWSFAALGAAGCASGAGVRAPIVYAGATEPPHLVPAPPSPTASRIVSPAFVSPPRAQLLGELVVCRGEVSNQGPVGERGESLVYTPLIHAPSGMLLRAPIERGCLSSGFGRRAEGFRQIGAAGDHQHSGIDLANPKGGYVFAAGDGRVTQLGWRGDYGLTLELDHGAGVHTLYAHLAEIDPALNLGSEVYGQSAIARMGATGNATGVHLHYEVMLGGIKVDPLAFGAENLEADATRAGGDPRPTLSFDGGSR